MVSSSPIVFRVRGLTADGGDDQQLGSALSTAIISRLGNDEKTQIDISVAIASSCYGSGKKVGLVTFRGGVPTFLAAVFKNPLQETQMEVGEADITFDCNFFDFTQLYAPEMPPLADVVAITGLDGHAYGSWRGKGELSRMWLRDFLSKDLPRCRVLTYGYNSKLTGKSRGLERILDYGRGFLEEIKQVRNTDEEMRRPLIFIAHSFGGLIVAQSLVQAVLSADRTNKLVYDATYAILFFGTPHRGLSVDDIRGLLSDHDHPRHGLLDQIKSNSDSLVDQLGNFKNIIQDRKIVSFYEAEQTPQLANDSAAGRWQRTGSFATAVGMDSALLNLPDHMEEKIPLSSNHSMMVKFDSRDSKGYQIAISRLRKFERDAGATIAARLDSNTPPGLRTHTEMRGTPNNSVEFVDTEMTMQPSSCCGSRPKASFTQHGLDSLSSEAYELFTSLKRKASSTNSSLGEIEQPLYSFKCALTHLTNNVSLVLSGPEPPEKLQAMVTAFARTLSELHEVAEHPPKKLDISAIRTDLENHSASVQKLLDTVLVNHSQRKLNVFHNEAQDTVLNMHPPKLVKRRVATFSTKSRYERPEPVPRPTMRPFTVSASTLGTSFIAMPQVLAVNPGPAPTSSPPPPPMEALENGVATCSIENKEVAPMKELSKDLIDINLRRRIASAATQDRLSIHTGMRSGRHIPAGALATTTGRGNRTDPAVPFSWTERLSSTLPLRPADARQRSREFSNWLRKLNNHMSGLPKHARLNFRRDLEEDGQFSNIIEQARKEYGEFAFVRKEIQVYQDDKEDDV